MNKFFFCRQHDSSDCDPSCLRMVFSAYFGRRFELYKLRDFSLGTKSYENNMYVCKNLNIYNSHEKYKSIGKTGNKWGE